jgi:hypothetical protein
VLQCSPPTAINPDQAIRQITHPKRTPSIASSSYSIRLDIHTAEQTAVERAHPKKACDGWIDRLIRVWRHRSLWQRLSCLPSRALCLFAPLRPWFHRVSLLSVQRMADGEMLARCMAPPRLGYMYLPTTNHPIPYPNLPIATVSSEPLCMDGRVLPRHRQTI